MTVKEIRERLKHIAGLCYGFSADLQYLEAENARLKADNDGVQNLLEINKKELIKLRCAISSYCVRYCAFIHAE